MYKHFALRRTIVLAFCASLLFSLQPGSEALSMKEKRQGIWGEVVDEQGEPVVGVEFALASVADADHPIKVKSNKKGKFQYPRVEFYKGGYTLKLVSDVYFIRDFSIRVRRMNSDIFQDDSGSLTPGSQDMLPVIRYRGGNCIVTFSLFKIEDFSSARAAAAAQAKQQEAARKKLEKKKEMTAEEVAEEALAYGDYQLAAEKFKIASGEAPDDMDLLWKFADSSASAGDSGAALRAARKVIAAEPERTGVRTKMALWMDEMGQLASAVPLLEEERKLDPENARLAKMLVTAYGVAGQKDKAAEATEVWAKLDPEGASALMALASLRASQSRFEESEALYTKIAGMDPEGAYRMFFNAGASILKSSGGVSEDDRKRAIVAFEKAIELKPDYLRAHAMAGDAYVGLGNFAKAREHYTYYVKNAPADDPLVATFKGMLEALP